MSLKHSILAVLTLGDCHGYQIRQEISNRTGETWQINIGQVYSTLERLVRDGFVRGSEPNSEGQIRYSATKLGKAEAVKWLLEPVIANAQEKHELAMKLALAVTLPGIDTQQIVNSQRVATLQNLQVLTTAKMNINPMDPQELAWTLILDSQIFATESELRWLDHVEGLLNQAAARGLSTQNKLSNEPARRGRPAKRENN